VDFTLLPLCQSTLLRYYPSAVALLRFCSTALLIHTMLQRRYRPLSFFTKTLIFQSGIMGMLIAIDLLLFDSMFLA